MNTLHLGRYVGDIKASAFKRYYLRQQLESLEHNTVIAFDSLAKSSDDAALTDSGPAIAHTAGTNCIAIDQTLGRYLVSGGADTAIRFWDLESHEATPSSEDIKREAFRPISSISKANQASHSHSITSLSLYPFDPVPSTLLTTSYDQSFLLTAITPSALHPLHKFPLDFTTYTHAISPIASTSTPLVAVGTSHPAPRLIDLRSALATHALPGHTGSIWSLAWHPQKEHILVSSSTAGQILVFDIRRATPAFASFDVDDNLGVIETNRPHLNYNTSAHSAPITGILFNRAGDKLISASQDQRIRVWDIATGKNDLVHFGPRIRNNREGELKPTLVPVGTNGVKAGRELLFWPNDDGRGEIFMHELREGTMLQVLRTKNVAQTSSQPQQHSNSRKGNFRTTGTNVNRMTSGGRINSLVFRPVRSEEGLGGSLEMYSAHGDGRICAWMPKVPEGQDEDERDESDGETAGSSEDEDNDENVPSRKKKTKQQMDAERSRKRKRDLIEGLVEGLTKRPITFS